MRFTQSGNTSFSWPLYVAEQKKLFEKNGLQVETIIIRGATNTTRAVLSETVPIGRINPDYVIGAIEKGAKVKIVSGNMEKIPYDIYARQEIKTGADLKGKTIGVSTLTGGTTLMVHEVLDKGLQAQGQRLQAPGRRHIAGALRSPQGRLGSCHIHGTAFHLSRR